MNFTAKELLTKVPQRDMRAVSRLITLVENNSPRVRKIQSELFKKSGHAHVIGVTGSPGAGKSTLVDQLAVQARKLGKRVAILAIDPSSPFSGGAILGDRIRMNKTVEDPDIYVRSMATRGALGGLSRATLDAVRVLDAAKFDLVFVETVGVGQGEVDIVRTADTCIVVLVPGMGDSVQAIKAGILEIADLFVINKADREGADILHKDLRTLLSLVENKKEDWEPPILRTVATQGDGVTEVVEKCLSHQRWLKSSAQGKERKLKIIQENIIRLASSIVLERVFANDSKRLMRMAQRCVDRKSDPYSVAKSLVRAR